MGPKFGTSGLRGLVVQLTEDLVADYIRAFVAACECDGVLFVGRDLRPSSPQIAEHVIEAARAQGLDVVDCGALPTPALALASMTAGVGAVMVTGSHIPADRNGLKFYLPTGEISKADEQAITANLGRSAGGKTGRRKSMDALTAFEDRYISAFGPSRLTGLRIGIYQHSAVARDVMVRVVEALGAQTVVLGRSNEFIPVDTEALDPATRALLAGWCDDHHLDVIMSTDGDSDRPMLVDHKGRVIAGDVLGVLTACHLGADQICTPVSSNSMVQHMHDFERVILTRIGSPFVIAAMEDVLVENPHAKVAGYEANGGFLLGFEAATKTGVLTPLMTRDSLLPMIAPLISAQDMGSSLADLVTSLPQIFTASDRLQGIAPEVGRAFLDDLLASRSARAIFFKYAGSEVGLDTTDGLRVTFASGDIIHLRPSGNAPEFRCYAEADNRDKVFHLIRTSIGRIKEALGAA